VKGFTSPGEVGGLEQFWQVHKIWKAAELNADDRIVNWHNPLRGSLAKYIRASGMSICYDFIILLVGIISKSVTERISW
jgi:hypothetical protein